MHKKYLSLSQTMIKGVVVALIVYFLVRYLLPQRITPRGAIYVGVAAFTAVALMEHIELRRESFDTDASAKTADEAGLVFGDVSQVSGIATSDKIYYSGMTTSLANDAQMYAGGAGSTAVQPFVTMVDNANTSSVLANFRLVGLDVKSFDKLTPLMFTQLFVIVHNQDHQDKFICSNNGKLTYGNTKPVGSDTSHVFRFVNPSNVNDNTGNITFSRPLLLQYSGSSAGSASFVYVDTDGTLNSNGTTDQATKFHLGDCIASCTGPTWRFT